MKIVVLGSSNGTSLDGILKSDLKHHIRLIVSDKSDAPILQKAVAHGIKIYSQNNAGMSRENYDKVMIPVIQNENPDLILMVGYMRIVSKCFIDAFEGKILNIHPSLLPKHAGLMDLDVHNSVLQAKDRVSGCSIHYVTEDVDAGQVILQLQCGVEINDTAQTLKAKVQKLEKQAWLDVVRQYKKGKVQ